MDGEWDIIIYWDGRVAMESGARRKLGAVCC